LGSHFEAQLAKSISIAISMAYWVGYFFTAAESLTVR
jgi:hypothetical protein